MLMCKINIGKVTATKKYNLGVFKYTMCMYKHTHTQTHCIIDEKEQLFQVSTVKVIERKQNYSMNKITLLWKNKEKMNILGQKAVQIIPK